ncbi:Small integral membrane protein 20 [Lemmus lemmus]
MAAARNLRTALIFGGFISMVGAAFYPIYFRPLMRLEEYQKEQAVNRAGIVQEDVQPPDDAIRKRLVAPLTLQEQSQPAGLFVDNLLLMQSLSLPSCDVNPSNLWAQEPWLLCHFWSK